MFVASIYLARESDITTRRAAAIASLITSARE
jgi:hypothetical protein